VVSKNDPREGTQVRQCSHDLFEGEGDRDRKNAFHLASWINPDRGELFFARKVVLVEGETERTALPFLATRLDCLDPSISVVDCGSKHNLPLYIELLNAFQLNYIVIHDEDPVPDPIPSGWCKDKVRAKRDTFALNDTIAHLVDPLLGEALVCAPDFEGLAGVSRNQGKKMGKALAALEYFTDRPVDEIPRNVASIVRRAYELTRTV
jgi:CRISPR-associated exonuclease Cas4